MKKGISLVIFIVGILTVLCGAAATTLGAVALGSRAGRR